ncbi:MAG TPA: glycosyltransferase, partial [Gemmataceae bacterium]|nr:glycosyltransferase [Gemmataceae bacterium]
EIEDATTLFCPFVYNGNTHDVDIQASPYFAPVNVLLESPSCRGIITHMRSTAETLPRLFRSEEIGAKTFHVPFGVGLPARPQTHEGREDHLRLLFTCSWHQDPESFFVRGGLDVLDAFEVLHARYPQLRLTLRTRLPRLPERYQRIVERCWVRVIDRFLPSEAMDDLLRESHVFLLPAARVHVVSVLQAMAFGQVVAWDGWGMGEYVHDGRNGLVVPGRYGKVTWMDEEAGLLREDYRAMHASDPAVVAGLVAAVSELAEDRAKRRYLGQMARLDVASSYSLDDWNRGLKTALDRALARG